MSSLLRRFTALIVLVGVAQSAHGSLLYKASLKNGDYGGGFQVGAGSGYLWNASGSTGGDLGLLGIIDSVEGVTYTTRNDVINYSLGADGKGGYRQSNFRSQGTVSVFFKAEVLRVCVGYWGRAVLRVARRRAAFRWPADRGPTRPMRQRRQMPPRARAIRD